MTLFRVDAVAGDPDTLRIALAAPTATLLGEIGDPRLGPVDVACCLAVVLNWGQGAQVDWPRVRAAAAIEAAGGRVGADRAPGSVGQVLGGLRR